MSRDKNKDMRTIRVKRKVIYQKTRMGQKKGRKHLNTMSQSGSGVNA